MYQKTGRKNKRSVLTFLVFLALSTALWLLIKLSKEYTTQTLFRVSFENVPADKWMAAPEQTAKFSMTTDGFHMLKYAMIREAKRSVGIPLDEVPYRREDGNTYSFSSQYVAERIADYLNIDASGITMNDAMVYFSMENLESKVLPVVLRSDLKMLRQYDVYGLPIMDPATVTVFGPKEVLDTLKSVKTEVLSRANLSEGFTASVGLVLLDGLIRSNVKETVVSVDVEKFTETDVKVPFSSPSGLKMRFFPEAMTVKCLVAIRNFADLNPDQFRVEIDQRQLDSLQPLLDVRLASWPQYVQVLGTNPDKVEYLIVQ